VLMKTRKTAIAVMIALVAAAVLASYLYVELTLRNTCEELAGWPLEISHLSSVNLVGSFKYLRLLGRRDAICEMGAEHAANQARRRLDSRDRGGWIGDPAAAAVITEAARECAQNSSDISRCHGQIISAYSKLWAEDTDGAREALIALGAGDPRCVALREYALSQIQILRHDPQGRVTHLKKALDHYGRLYPDGHWTSARALFDYGDALMEVKRYDEALAALEESLRWVRESGAPEITLSLIRQKLGSCLIALRKYDEALDQYQKVLAAKQAVFGDEGVEVGRAFHDLGEAHSRAGQFDEAAESFLAALAIYRQALPEDHRDLEDLLKSLALACDAAGDYERAKNYHRQALAVVRKKLPKGHPRLAEVMQDLAAVELSTGRYDEAIRLHREALAIYRKTSEGGSRILGAALMDYAKLYKAKGYAALAARFAREAVEAWSQILPSDHVDILEARKFLEEAPDISDTPKISFQSETSGDGPSFLVPEGVSEPPQSESKLPDGTHWDPSSGRIPSSIFYRYSSFNLNNIEKVKSLVRERIKGGQYLPSLFHGDSVDLDIRKYLKLSQSDVIADIGCGTGGFEVTLLVKGIPFKKIYAVDIDRYSLDILKFILEESRLPGHENIQIVQNTLTDAGLPKDSIDVMLLLNTPLYVSEDVHHNIKPDTLSTLKSMYFALKTGGRLYVFDRVEVFEGVSEPFGQIIRPFESVGFKAIHRERMRIENPHHHVVFIK
jgi:tetratricopeptide (TPR) repeat protein/SAM-dependent methyltransferase